MHFGFSNSVGNCREVVVVSGILVIGGRETAVEAMDVRGSAGGGMKDSKLAPVHVIEPQLTVECGLQAMDWGLDVSS